MIFTEKEIIALFEKRWSEVDKKNVKFILETDSPTNALECMLMHLYILNVRPRFVLEFNPGHGHSTFAIASAQRAMRHRWAFNTFETDPVLAGETQALIERSGLDEFCQVFKGDALKEVPTVYQKRRSFFDLCFINTPYTKEDAARYIKKLFPLFQPDCLIGINGITGKKRSKTGRSPFKSGGKGPITKFIKDNKCKYNVLHSVTGGGDLSLNDELYEAIKKISGVDFRESASASCSKTLFFRLK